MCRPGLGVTLGGYTWIVVNSFLMTTHFIEASCYTVRSPAGCVALKLKELAEAEDSLTRQKQQTQSTQVRTIRARPNR